MERSNYYKLSLRISWISIALNVFLAGTKFVVGVSSNSLSILSDGAHTLTDIFTTVIVIFSILISRKPPDKEHPYGHGRAEDIGGVVLSLLLFFAGVALAWEAIGRLWTPQVMHISRAIIVLIFLMAGLKLVLAVATARIANRLGSGLLQTDALHHCSDCVTTIAVGCGLFFVKKGLLHVDSALAFAIGILIIFWAYRTGKRFIDHLMGKPPDERLAQQIKEVASQYPEVQGVHGVEVHAYGSERWISLHIELDPLMTFENSHDIADAVEKNMRQSGIGKCVVHVDVFKNTQKGDALHES